MPHDESVLLIHMDYDYGEHAYMLYRVARDELALARGTAAKAWDDYDDAGRAGCWEEYLESALTGAGIRFEVLDYELLDVLA